MNRSALVSWRWIAIVVVFLLSGGNSLVSMAAEDDFEVEESARHAAIQENQRLERNTAPNQRYRKRQPGEPPSDLADFPVPVRPAVLKAASLMDDKNYDAALKCFEDALKIEPNCIPLLRRRCFVLMRKGDYPAAAAGFTYVLEKDSKNPKTLRSLRMRGRCYAYMGLRDKALADLTRLIAADPTDYNALYDRAVIYTQLGKSKEADADRKKAAVVEAPHKLQSLMSEGKFTEALTILEQSLKSDPDNSKLRLARAKVLANIGKLAEATSEYDKLLEKEPTARHWRGKAFESKGKTDQAIKDYAGAIAACSKISDAHERAEELAACYEDRARVYLKVSKPDLAIKDCTAALGITKTGDLYALRADAYSMKHDYTMALADYCTASKLSPRFEHALMAGADVARKLGDSSVELANYSTLVRLHPQVGDLYLRRAHAYEAMHNLAAAEADLAQSIKFDATDEVSYENRAHIRAQLGNLTGAIDDYTHAIKVAPQSAAVVLPKRAALYEKLGKTKEATADRLAAKQFPEVKDPLVEKE